VARAGDRGTEPAGLQRRAPQRCADVHGGEFAVGALHAEGHAGLLVFLGKPRIEHAAEVDVAGMAAAGDDDTLARLDGQFSIAVARRDAEDPPSVVVFAHDAGQLVAQQDLHALLVCAGGQRAHQA
jgi:hypothetical protein